MSWGGPVAGAPPPFQQPPYANGQPGYSLQASYQYGQQPGYGQYPFGPTHPPLGQFQRPPDNRQLKKKGNPVITRYPPPPGYRGPAQSQAPFSANQYPNQHLNQYQPPSQPGYSQAGYPQAPPGPPAYPLQGYTAPPANPVYAPQGYGQVQPPQYSQPPHAQSQHYQWPQQGYASNPGYSQPPVQPPLQSYVTPQIHHQSYPPQSTPGDPNQHSFGQAPGWPHQNGQVPYPQSNSHNPYGSHPQNGLPTLDPNATPTPANVHPALSQPSQVPGQPSSIKDESSPSERPQLFLGWDDWDFDFDGAIWPKSNEPVDPNLSLGVIIWHPAKQMTRALPSTFHAAEEQALRPTPEKLDNGESVSMYFTAENSHEAFLDVRQTDDWDEIRDDPVFVVFGDVEMRHNLVSLEDCIAQRDRPSESKNELGSDEDQEMQDAGWDVMGNLHALLSGNEDPEPEIMKTEAAFPPRPNQEEVLAMLGVTGIPKPACNESVALPQSTADGSTPVEVPAKPAVLPPPLKNHAALPPQRAQSYGGHRNSGYGGPPQRPYGSMSSSTILRPPPPPPPPEQQRYDPWNAPQKTEHDMGGARGSPAHSEGSNRTMAGSDFESEKPSTGIPQDTPVVPLLNRSDSSFSRKRSYEDTDQENERLRQQDDHTKRKRRSQVDAAYSRR